MLAQPDIAEVPEQKAEWHQCKSNAGDNEIDTGLPRFRNQQRPEENGRQAHCSVIKALEQEINDIPDSFADINTVDIENIAHRGLNRVKHAFREMSDFLYDALIFSRIFSGVDCLFGQTAEHAFNGRGGPFRIRIRRVFDSVANLREGKNHDQRDQQRGDETDPDMFSELSIVPDDREQKNTQ